MAIVAELSRMSDLIPEKHIRWNHYWDARTNDEKAPDQPGPRALWAPAFRARKTLARWPRTQDPKGPERRFSHQRGAIDRSDLNIVLPLLDKHIDHLRSKLAVYLRLQLIHVAGPITTFAFGDMVVAGQYCSRCANAVALASRFAIEPGGELVTDAGFWREGVILLERWESSYLTDNRWRVMTSADDELPDPGFISCEVLKTL
jgi:hypothetical protein